MTMSPDDQYKANRSTKSRRQYASTGRDRLLIKKYGMTASAIELMAKEQGGCGVCGTLEPGGQWNTWHVDHDHTCCSGIYTCGECVRGVLCNRCNIGLGAFKDDPQLLALAQVYLESHSRVTR